MTGIMSKAREPLMKIVFVALSLNVVAASCLVWRLTDVQCAPENSPSAIFMSVAISETHCVMTASEKAPTGALVAQFNQNTRTCTVFKFQSICRDLIAGQSPNCAVFYRFQINHSSLNPKLNNVWLADSVNRLENLVCQADEDTNRLHPTDIQWSSEGAVFDGVSAFAKLNKTNIDFSTGITWLVRLKRKPANQPFFEFNDCSTLGQAVQYSTHMWEFDAPKRVYVRLGTATGMPLQSQKTLVDILPASESDWNNIGFTTTPTGNSSGIFVGNSLLPSSDVQKFSEPDTPISNLCMLVGMRVTSGSNPMFNGTLRALAFANVSMSEVEIREFFELLGA